MNKKYIILLFITALTLGSVSCDDYLSTTPDNRTELDTKQNITKLLVTGYATSSYVYLTEFMSDNIDDRGNNGYSSLSRLQEQTYAWEDTQEVGLDSPKSFWASCYAAIATANHALEAIENYENPEELNPQKAEALLIRAYHHFLLVNVFCKQYNEQTSNSDLGIPYTEIPETTVSPYYDRGTVAEVYQKIQKDLEEALPLVDDNIYTVPKYHFNKKAAYAFAARFYLYMHKYDKVIECANVVFGGAPENILRDMTVIDRSAQYGPIAEDYVKTEHQANLMLISLNSDIAVAFGNYANGKKYQHCKFTALETVQSEGPWGKWNAELFYLPALSYSAGYISTPKLPYYFEYTDPVAKIGYTHSILPAFQSDELLLCRAEAYIMLQDYSGATNDLAIWMSRHTTSTIKLTRELINSYYSSLADYTPYEPTVKKQLNPATPIVSEEQENFLQCLLHFRRIETVHEGLRWFDIKRFGIKIYRRYVNPNNDVTVTDSLEVDDPRRALQIPYDVISAGMTPNPR